MNNINLTNNSTKQSTAPTAPVPMQNGAVTYSANVDNAIAEWKAYQEVTEKILDESDYVLIKGNNYKKKSAWRKYARAFNISTEILEKDILKNDKGSVTEASFVVRATLPSGRYADGWGNCSRREGNKAHPNHDIPATAMTRASNRAIADLIGAGEVTAEEIQGEIRETARSNAKAKIQKPKPQQQGSDLEFIDVKPENVKVEVVKDDPQKTMHMLDDPSDIAKSIIAELPERTLKAAYDELMRLNKLAVLTDEECAAVKVELDKVLK